MTANSPNAKLVETGWKASAAPSAAAPPLAQAATPRATTEKARAAQMASMSRLANFETVAVDWKR